MAVYPPKSIQSAIEEKSDRSKSRPRLVFDEQHQFRKKNNRSLSHLQESREFLPCTACSTEAHRRQEFFRRPSSSCQRHESTPPVNKEQRPSTGTKSQASRRPPSAADLDRLSRPKPVSSERLLTDNCNWSNFIKRKTIKTPYGLCDLTHGNENSEIRPPFVNYGGRHSDKQNGEKRTYNSLAIHQLKHHEVEGQRLADILRERRLRLQAENYFREVEERNAQAQDLRDRAARASTEYRDNYQPPPQNYYAEGTSSRQ
ncbi:unnamed protein product [Adineta ricciae]|uniref:Uncharacterized protein n=1 Tax=Adineta ricciae TaxID=249248 RepID=A0A815HGR3_ADIRI|nr:unnamed protein product [Adineta ricciae]CAF1351259.1 unnamed protein product [Adineta ricciae]